MTTKSKTITKPKSLNEIKEGISCCMSLDDPTMVLKGVEKEISKSKGGTNLPTRVESNLFKSMTLFEFDNGVLLATAVPEQYKTFGIDFMRNLQKEHDCQTSSEKATAELVAVNYIRTLEIERRMTAYLAINSLTEVGIKYLAIMSKELDRANRHYLTSIQVLRNLKQLPFQLTLKANTAVIGQNQIVQANSHE